MSKACITLDGAQWIFPNNYLTSLRSMKQLRPSILPKAQTRWHQRGSNSRSSEPESCTVSLNHTLSILYAMKVMTSFGYEIMLSRGFWFQTLDVNKPWRQIPADRLLFFGVHTFFISDVPKAIRRGEISFKSNHVIERNFEAANSRITVTSSGQL